MARARGLRRGHGARRFVRRCCDSAYQGFRWVEALGACLVAFETTDRRVHRDRGDRVSLGAARRRQHRRRWRGARVQRRSRYRCAGHWLFDAHPRSVGSATRCEYLGLFRFQRNPSTIASRATRDVVFPGTAGATMVVVDRVLTTAAYASDPNPLLLRFRSTAPPPMAPPARRRSARRSSSCAACMVAATGTRADGGPAVETSEDGCGCTVTMGSPPVHVAPLLAMALMAGARLRVRRRRRR